MSPRPLRVVQSVRTPSPRTNPYVVQLAAALEATGEAEVRWYSWPRAAFGRYDVLHAHWPEVMIRRDGRAARAAARLRFAVLLARLALDRRIAVVRTVHNLAAHESGDRVERFLLARFERRTDHRIALNDAVPAGDPARTTVALHGDYRDWYAGHEVPGRVPGRLLYFGLIRPYKGVEALVAAFRELPDAGASLRVVGSPAGAGLGDRIRAAAAGDGRAGLLLEYVDDATLAREVGEAELVVLPYDDMHNSGALLLALSLGRPALVPSSPVTDAVAAEVGAGWVLTYRGPLTADVLADAARAAARTDPLSSPDLGRRRWPLIADQHLAAYRAAARSTRGS